MLVGAGTVETSQVYRALVSASPSRHQQKLGQGLCQSSSGLNGRCLAPLDHIRLSGHWQMTIP